MENKLFVGGLPFAVTDAELQATFAEVGEVVSATIITDKETGRSRGFGFVVMATKEGMEAAIARFNGSDMNGRTITVSEARPQADRPARNF